MAFNQLLGNPRFKLVFITLAAFAAIFFIMNMFVVGGDVVYLWVNNIATPGLAIITLIQLYAIWRDSTQDKTAHAVWTYLLIGLALWTIADTIWAVYALFLNIEVPYPSVADGVWIAGYFLLFVGLYAQFRTYNIHPTWQVWQNILIFTIALVALTGYFVILPIIQDFDLEKLGEGLLNILYTVVDLVLLILSFLILSTLGQGKLAVSWKIIGFGFALRAVADLMFSYATWHELYSPSADINQITAFYDFIYAISFPVIGLGFVAYRSLTAELSAGESVGSQPEIARNFILISTNGANEVISFSDNFLALLKRTDGQKIKGASLHKLLGLNEASVKTFETEILRHGMVDSLPFQVKHADGKIDVRLSALAVYYEGKSFKGANIVFSTLSHLGVQDNLSVESKGMVKHILSKTGNLQRQTKAALSAYFNAQMRGLEELVSQYSGEMIAQTMHAVINDAASEKGSQVLKDGADFVILAQPDNAMLAKVMSDLLAAARAYAIDMVGMQLVSVEVDRVNTHMDPDVMNTVDQYGLRLKD